jgi:hypothetical protein
MLDARIRIGLLTFALVAFAFVGFLSSAWPHSPQSATLDADEVPIFLDGEPFGSTANTTRLKAHLTSLKARLPNMNAGGEALPNLGGLVVVPNNETSMATVASLFEDVVDAAGTSGFGKIVIGGDRPCSGDKTRKTFVLSNRTMSFDELRKTRDSLECWPATTIIESGATSNYSKRLLKSYRTSATSLEITESGSYLLNERAPSAASRVSPMANLNHPTFGRRVDSAVLRQRPIEAAKLESEVLAWITLRSSEGSDDLRWNDDGTVVLPIIVNANTRFSSLASILTFIKRADLTVTLVVESSPGKA